MGFETMPSQPSAERSQEQEEREKEVRDLETQIQLSSIDVITEEIKRNIVLPEDERKKIQDLFSGAELPADVSPVTIANFLEKEGRRLREETALRLKDRHEVLADQEDPQQHLVDLESRKEALSVAMGRSIMRRSFSGGLPPQVKAESPIRVAGRFQALPKEAIYKRGERTVSKVDRVELLFEIEALRNSILREKLYLAFLKPGDYIENILTYDERRRIEETEKKEGSKFFGKRKPKRDLVADSIRNIIGRAARLIAERELFLKDGKELDWNRDTGISGSDKKRLEEEARRAVDGISISGALPDTSQAKRLIDELDKLSFMKAGE